MNLPSFFRSLRDRCLGGARSRRRVRTQDAGRSRSARPRMQIESLEDRCLMATLPAVDVLQDSQVLLGGTHSPVVVADPINPDRFVVVSSGPTVNNVGTLIGRFTVDGGKNWSTFAPVSGISEVGFVGLPQADNVTGAMDRDGNIYIAHMMHDAGLTAGALVFQKWRFSHDADGNATVVSVAQADREDIDPRTFGLQNFQVLERYFGSVDRIFNPVLAVNPNPVLFTDPETGQVQLDPFTDSPVYLAFQQVNNVPNTAGPTDINGQTLFPNALNRFNPNVIKIAASHDGGRSFTTDQFLNDGFNYTGTNNAGVPLNSFTLPRLLFTPTTAETIQNFAAVTPAVPLPITDAGTVFSTINIPPSLLTNDHVVGDVDVNVTLTHPTSNQLVLTLISPRGLRVPLANANGTGANFTGTTFDDEAATSLNFTAAPFTGRFRPVGSLNVLEGEPIDGNWRLEISDTTLGSTGTLQSWSMDITPTRGGLLTALWTNVATVNAANPNSSIVADPNFGQRLGSTSLTGTRYDQESSTAIFFDSSPSGIDDLGIPTGRNIREATIPQSGDHIPRTTSFSFDVNIDPNDPDTRNFTTVTDIDVVINLIHPHLNQIAIDLVTPPTFPGGQQTVRLLHNKTQPNGQNIDNVTINGLVLQIGLPDNNGTPTSIEGLGARRVPGRGDIAIGTVFDQDAARPINDITGAVPYVGRWRPEGFFNFFGTALSGSGSLPSFFGPDTAGLDIFNGRSAADINGVWELRITDHRDTQENPRPPQFLMDWELHISSKVDINGFNIDRVAVPPTAAGASNISGIAAGSATSAISPPAIAPWVTRPNSSPDRGIAPAFDLAIDRTLGSFSINQGRIYLAYTTRTQDIGMFASDNGGVSWYLVNNRINSDDAFDGITEGSRSQYLPQVSVDPFTGTLVASWFDARNDAANARVSTYIASSIDGGFTWSEQTFLNPVHDAIDAISGENIVIEPVPSNQSTGNGGRDQVYNVGDRQGLAVVNGTIIAAWTGDLNGNGRNTALVTPAGHGIWTTRAYVAAGPRIVQSDMGPVIDKFEYTDPRTGVVTTYNNLDASDGTRMLDGFLVVFDRPIDPRTFTPEDVTLIYRDALKTLAVDGVKIPVANITVTPLDIGQLYGNIQPGSLDRTRLVGNEVLLGTTRRTFTATVPAPIPDVGKVTSTLSLSPALFPDLFLPANSDKIINDLNVTVNLTHPNVGSLRLTLVSPKGTRVQLTNQSGTGANYTNTTFDDEAGLPIQGGTAPFTGSFRPVGFVSDFDGEPIGGDWKLEVEDISGGNTTGTINGWSMDVLAGSGVATTFLVKFPPQSGVGTYSYAIGPDIQDRIRNVVPSFVIDEDKLVPTANQSIPDGDFNRSIINIAPGDFTNNFQNNQKVGKVRVSVRLNHGFTGNLTLTLISPSGTRIDLVNRKGGAGNNFGGNSLGAPFFTVFDDDAVTPISAGFGPFDGEFIPDESLSALIGERIDGDWTLEVHDHTAGDFELGTLLQWKLQITPTAVHTINQVVPAANQVIPDGGTRSSIINITPAATAGQKVGHVRVSARINHPFTGHLRLALLSPAGTRIMLSNTNGGAGDNYGVEVTDSDGNVRTFFATFDEDGRQAIAAGTAPFAATFRPDGNGPTPLAGFAPGLNLNSLIGQDIAGNWTLEVVDTTAADGEAGRLLEWKLVITPQSTAAVTSVANGRFKNFKAVDLPKVVGDLAGIPGSGTPTVTSQIQVSGLTNLINDVRVNVTLPHRRAHDVLLVLIAPNGKRVLLSGMPDTLNKLPPFVFPNDFIGPGVDSDGYFRTTFDDRALWGMPDDPLSFFPGQPLIPDVNAPVRTELPFTGSYRPQRFGDTLPDDRDNPIQVGLGPNALRTLKNDNPNGIWTLEVYDVSDQPPGAQGVLTEWSLDILDGVATPADGIIRGAYVDQDADGTSKETPGDVYAIPEPIGEEPFTLPYNPDTLPLIVPGPHFEIPKTFTAKGNQVNLPVPSSGNGGSFTDADLTTSTIAVAGYDLDQTIVDVNVNVRIAHQRPGDLTMTLIAPDGTAVDLIRVPASGAQDITDRPNLSNTTFDDQASVSIVGAAAPFIGRFRPKEPLTLLNSHKPNGTWTLRIRDEAGGLVTLLDGNGDILAPARNSPSAGILHGWSITLDTTRIVVDGTTTFMDVKFDRDMDASSFTENNIVQIVGPAGVILPTASEPFKVTAQADKRTFRISFPKQELNGTYKIQFGPDASAPDKFVKSLAGHKMDLNLNAGVYELRGTNQFSNVVIPVVKTNATDKTLAPGQTITSTVDFPETFAIQATQVKLTINALNGLVSNSIDAILEGPDGTRVQLFTGGPWRETGPGGTGPQGFQNTILDDRNPPPVPPGNIVISSPPIQEGDPPFQGFHKPQQPLSAFQGKASGVGTNRSWTLILRHKGSSGIAVLDQWSLQLERDEPGTGLGEPFGDLATSHFTIFSMDPTNKLAQQIWTAVGPASLNNNANAGRVTSVAVDPNDPSGNTVYIGAASGGVWKTTNFLTQESVGPTWQALTDFGPVSGLHIGSIGLFGRAGDPRQTIIFAGTGEGPADQQISTVSLNSENGVGFLYSEDGGLNWRLLDSLNNDPSLTFAARDHWFVGTKVYKVVVDPVPSKFTNKPIVYAAVSDVTTTGRGGIYRSIDGGINWAQLNVSAPTNDAEQGSDVILDQYDVDPLTGNIRGIYASLQGNNGGVYRSESQGTNWAPLDSATGSPLIRDVDPLFVGLPSVPIPVAAPPDTPFGNKGRIVLARVPLTEGLGKDPVKDLLYSGWLYAAVADANGGFDGLYISKDFGQNWTFVQRPGRTLPSGVVIPSNDETLPDFSLSPNGNLALTLAVDPTNPNVVYLGGLGVLRIDLQRLNDPHNLTAYDHSDNDGGRTARDSVGSLVLDEQIPPGRPPLQITGPYGLSSGTTGRLPYRMAEPDLQGFPFAEFGEEISRPYLNLIKDPDNIFATNATLLARNPESDGVNPQGFQNDGSGAVWTYFTDIQRPNPFDGTSPTTINLTHMITTVDPLTGRSRLIFGDDQGVYTGVDDGKQFLTRGIGTAFTPNGSRNGNLQIAQMFQGATQPSLAAAEVGQALFYGTAQDNGAHDRSRSDILSTGYLVWDAPYQDAPPAPATTTSFYGDPYGEGTGVATDQVGTGRAYHYVWPEDLTLPTNMFQVTNPGVNPVGRTFGLFQSPNDNQWRRGFQPGLRFAVNPINGQQLAISSQDGRIFRSRPPSGEGQVWSIIGFAPADNALASRKLDGSYAQALAYGAPDPASPFNNTDDILWAGTVNGNLFVTIDGGGGWTNFGSLDGSPVQKIVTNPLRGSQEAYIVTEDNVFHVTFTATYNLNGTSTISNIVTQNLTGNLLTISHDIFRDTKFQENLLDSLSQTNKLTSLAVDWRWKIPDNPNVGGGPVHPALYVSGISGVFRAMDFNRTNPAGITWEVFPNNRPVTQTNGDGAPVAGGYLPVAYVTDLDLSVGNIDPTTGLPNQGAGPNMLVATTFGRGAFAIRLDDDSPFNFVSGPRVVAIGPAVSGSVPGLGFVEVTFDGAVDETYFTKDDVTVIKPGGGTVTVTNVVDVSVAPPAPSNLPRGNNVFRIFFDSPQTIGGIYTVVIGPHVQDFSGHEMNQNGNGANGEPTDTFTGTVEVTSFRIVSATSLSSATTPWAGPIKVVFSLPVDEATFKANEDIELFAPGGVVTIPTDVAVVAGTDSKEWEINFPTQVVAGEYRLRIGPNVQFRTTVVPPDPTVLELDQNGNGVPGEDPDFINNLAKDQFRQSFFIGVQPPVVVPPVTGGGVSATGAPVGPNAPLAYIITRRRRRGNRVILDIRVFNFSTGAIAPLLIIMTPNRKDRIIGGAFSRDILPGSTYGQFGLDPFAVNSQDGQSFRISIRTNKKLPPLLIFPTDGQLII